VKRQLKQISEQEDRDWGKEGEGYKQCVRSNQGGRDGMVRTQGSRHQQGALRVLSSCL
jgi:hypothetical protein